MKVAIISPIMAHYREGLYRVLDRTEGIEFVHFSDPDDPRRGIKSLRPHEVQSFRALRNKTISRATWQVGVMRAVLAGEFDAYIFTGDASILSTWVAASIARLNGSRVYFWTMGWRKKDKGLKRLVRLAFYRLANKLLVLSDRGKNLGVEAGYPAERISVIYNSVTPVAAVDGPKGGVGGKKTAWTLGAVARLIPSKEFSRLIDAAAVLQRNGQSVRVILGGEGPERARLRIQAESLGVDCQFSGGVYGPAQLAAFYRDLTVTVVPAAAGLTVIQSLAYGVPVVSNDDFWTQGPEVAAVVEGSTGSLYRKDDLADLIEQISFWASTMAQDREEVAAACQAEVATRWSFEAQARFMLAAITEKA